MAMKLGKLGVWSSVDHFSSPEAADFAAQLEAWGYAALWMPEAVGRDPFSIISYMAAKTSKLVFATGIANIYARDPTSMKAIHKTVAELAPGRFILGLGVSHAQLVSDVRGHEYKKPVTTMRNYLEAMKKAIYMAKEPAEEAPIVLAALRQNMLKLAAEKVSGAHPYFVTPEHTAKAREIMGPDAWLCPEQMVLQETDTENARSVARKHMAMYLELPNYQNNLKELGFNDDDFENGGSDRIVDAIVAWGDEQAIRRRIDAHYEAGATHVCIQPFRSDGETGPDMKLLELLAPGS